MVNVLDKKEIVRAIREAEKGSTGEIRVHLAPRSGEDTLRDAEKVFARLRMHRTRHRNGVLIFVALKSRCFAIVGDEAMHAKVGERFWSETRDRMAPHFLKGDIAKGIVEGVRSAGEKLKRHFPSDGRDANELPDTVTGG